MTGNLVRRLLPKLRRFLGIPRALQELRDGGQVVAHSPQFLILPTWLILHLVCGPVRGKLTCPDNLTILLVHDYREMPLTEYSLRYVGIQNYVVLRPRREGRFVNTMKVTSILEYLDSGACSTEYVLYVDSNDVVFQDHPHRALDALQALGCDLLFSTERESYLYECMPEVKAWTDQKACEHSAPNRYINAGVFVGRARFIRDVLAEAVKYCGPSEPTHRELVRMIHDGSVRQRFPEFPKRIGSDQAILRYLHPRFYPRMQCDYADALAFRKLPEGGGL